MMPEGEKNIYKLEETLSKASVLFFLTSCYTKDKKIVLSYSSANEIILIRQTEFRVPEASLSFVILLAPLLKSGY